MRDQLVAALTQIERCTVVIEACTGAFYWARKFEALGHQLKIRSPQYVKPFGAPRRCVLPVEEESTQRVVD
jgi:transposase